MAILSRLLRFGKALGALLRWIVGAPRRAIRWLFSHLSNVTATVWLAGMATFVGLTIWRVAEVRSAAQAREEEKAAAAGAAQVEAEVLAQLEGRPLVPDAGPGGISIGSPAEILAADAQSRRARMAAEGVLVEAAPGADTARSAPGGPGNVVVVQDLDEIERARGGADEETRAALPPDHVEEEAADVPAGDAGVRSTLGMLQEIAKARGGGGAENIDEETRALLRESAPGGARADDDGPVSVVMPEGGMIAWIERNRGKRKTVGDKETLAILQEVHGPPQTPTGPAGPPLSIRSDEGALADDARPQQAAPDAARPAVAEEALPSQIVLPAPGGETVPAAPPLGFDLQALGLAVALATRDVTSPPLPQAIPAPQVTGRRRALAPLEKNGRLEVVERADGQALLISTADLFGPEKNARMKTAGRTLLRDIVAALDEEPALRFEVVIRGGEAGKKGWSLQALRAAAIAGVMADGGIDPARLSVTVRGKAMTLADSKAADKRSHPVEIRLLPAAGEVPQAQPHDGPGR